jgi:hypothetical protein
MLTSDQLEQPHFQEAFGLNRRASLQTKQAFACKSLASSKERVPAQPQEKSAASKEYNQLSS